MVHPMKIQAILQWYNSLTTKGDVNSLAQFTDGMHFNEMVASLQPVTLHGHKEGNLSESAIFSETSVACNEVVITSVEEEAAKEKMETTLAESGNGDPLVIKETEHTNTNKKYDAIRTFINDFYHVESSFIDYGECQNGKELELAKVAVFLLSAMVQNLLSSEDKVVYNTTLLEPEVQENIRECLSFVLVEKDMGENQIKKPELHKILSRPASYKGTPIRKQPSRSISDSNELSEGGKNVPKIKKERKSAIIYEDVQYSPLKNLLESPKIQYKAAIFKKELELAKLRGSLANEENKFIELTLERKNFNDELEKKDKELEFYKKQLESQLEAFCEKEDLSPEELKPDKIKGLRKLFEIREEEKKQLNEENEALQEKIIEIEKKLEKQAAKATLIEENTRLKDENEILNRNNEKKYETIKNLNEKATHIANDLKMYQQMYHDFSAPNSRRELRSPNVPETISTIIYADEQSSRETLERKEHDLRQTPEAKDERMKRLGLLRKSDPSKNQNLNVELQQVTVDRLLGDVHSLEKEKRILKEKLEYYQLKFGSTTDDAPKVKNLNSVEKESDRIDAASDNSGPSTSKNGNKVEGRKSKLATIIKLLERKNLIAPALLRRLKENCEEIREAKEFCACLSELASALRQPVMTAIVTRRARAVAAEEAETNALINKKLNLERDLEVLKIKMMNKDDELKMASEKLEALIDESMKERQKLKQELAVLQKKYKNMELLAKMKDETVKKSLIMYHRIVKLCKENKAKKQVCGKVCEQLRWRAKEQEKEIAESEKDIARARALIKLYKGQIANLQYEVVNITKQIKETQHKLFKETGLSYDIALPDLSLYPIAQEAKDLPRNSTEHVMRFTRYAENEPSSSKLPSDMFNDMDDSDDFEEDSDEKMPVQKTPQNKTPKGRQSLSEKKVTFDMTKNTPGKIPNKNNNSVVKKTPTPAKGKGALQEFKGMKGGKPQQKKADKEDFLTPTERKYSAYNTKSEYVEDDSEDSEDEDTDDEDSEDEDTDDEGTDNSSSYQVKMHKLAACIAAPVVKKQCRHTAKKSLATPLKRAAVFVRRKPILKGPVTVQCLKTMPRKRKAH